ncbi:MAG: hypothetical protein LUC47_01690 [Clostridiales bacterium]|nr:hypothetical protein [Clostridiales bacterium]
MLKIDPEFADQIPPLTEEEFRQLEANILSDGEVINPIIVWNGVIVDGHNRFRVLELHPEVSYKTFEKQFSDRSEVVAWICKNQLGRRNLTPVQRKYLIGKQYETEKSPHGGNRGTIRDEETGEFTASSENQNLRSGGKTCERIAKENHVGKDYVVRAGHFANGIDAAEEAVPGTRQEILSGKICPVDAVVQAVAQAPPEEREGLANHLRDPEVQRRGKPRSEIKRTQAERQQEEPDPSTPFDDEEEPAPVTKVSRKQIMEIYNSMLNSDGITTEDDVVLDMQDAVDTLIFRWNKCLELNPEIAKRDNFLQPYQTNRKRRYPLLTELLGGKNETCRMSV